ncbi:MAG TPA: ABC transporter ATP-binding protein [Herpetosiphon sp.]|uniref:ABC transporter related n=1 Tax=Herpetosiphon aurantiacus (strain ATCC 23779 / DSM 785 / 114-95) TaxID=316274 RepID=A9B651_HERA2|nr:ABC transporter ATP-binding protein [Herpetosiphon sp.]ABX06262.1 ABC transporter related [Herpetosiphon aurantiacus DSM 785]HBW48842.1 ABC transporter ATP-binding protein [Herpetosiphon sp.]
MKHLDQYRRLLAHLRPYPRQVFYAYGSTLLAVGLNIAIPQLLKQAIDEGIASGSSRALLITALIILGVAVVRVIFGFAQRYYGEWLSFRVAYDLRNRFYDAIQRLPFSFHDRSQTGDLMSRATSDITETERFVGVGLLELSSTMLLLFGIIVAMVVEDLRLTGLALLPLPVLLYATIRFGNTVEPLFTKIQEQMGKLSTMMQESLTGIRVVKAFAREPYELEKFDRDNGEWYNRRFAVIRIWGNSWPFFNFLVAISVIILLWIGGPQAMNGTITVGSLFAMISYVLLLNNPVQRLGFTVNLAATAVASSARVFEIIDTFDELADKADAHSLEHVQGNVKFEHVSFAYREGGRPTLHDISFEAKPGQVVALMGPTGSGKSTITNLIPRFYDPIEGRVLVDDHDVRDLAIQSLRQQIGIVLQDSFLFSSSIADNIRYGRPEASDEEVIAAAKAARAHDFILHFSEGYQTKIGERGVTLSGGQRQRIAIARALLLNPRILILDDSTSSVDTETEHLIQQALEQLMQGRTTFVIAQRLLTLKNADQILVLDAGNVVQHGTHTELLAQPGLYRTIYDLQLKDQEESLVEEQRA